MERVTVYIDGFNLYYGLRRMKAVDNDWQKFYWIDFVKFFDHFIGGGNKILQKVVYFTTPPLNIQKRNRQRMLFLANKLLNGNRFEVIEGKFYDKLQICPKCQSQYTTPEEKRTNLSNDPRWFPEQYRYTIFGKRRQRPCAATRNNKK